MARFHEGIAMLGTRIRIWRTGDDGEYMLWAEEVSHGLARYDEQLWFKIMLSGIHGTVCFVYFFLACRVIEVKCNLCVIIMCLTMNYIRLILIKWKIQQKLRFSWLFTCVLSCIYLCSRIFLWFMSNLELLMFRRLYLIVQNTRTVRHPTVSVFREQENDCKYILLSRESLPYIRIPRGILPIFSLDLIHGKI